MFREVIEMTELSDGLASKALDEVYGSNIGRDSTFISTLRALVYPRLGRNEDGSLGESLCFNYWRHPTPNSVNHELADENLSNRLILIETVEGLEDEFIKEVIRDDYAEVKKVRAFFVKAGFVRCFINTERKVSILIVSRLSSKFEHYLQSGLFAYLPWYFDPKDGVKDYEMKLIKSLQEITPDTYLETIREISEKFKLKDMYTRKALNGIESHIHDEEVNAVEYEISRIDNWFEEMYERIRNKTEELNQYRVKLLGLKAAAAELDLSNDLLDYFEHNKIVELDDVAGNKITFSAYDYIEFYDELNAESVINNPNSVFYEELPSGYMNAENMRLLLTEIFINKNIKIRVCGKYSIDLIRGYSDPGNSFSAHHNGLYKKKNVMPNPHLHEHSCLGEYVEYLSRCMRDGNYIGAIEQCIASVRSINFKDGVVMGEFRDYLCGECVNTRFLELEDGRIITPKEAIEWIKSKEEEEHE